MGDLVPAKNTAQVETNTDSVHLRGQSLVKQIRLWPLNPDITSDRASQTSVRANMISTMIVVSTLAAAVAPLYVLPSIHEMKPLFRSNLRSGILWCSAEGLTDGYISLCVPSSRPTAYSNRPRPYQRTTLIIFTVLTIPNATLVVPRPN